MARFSSRATVLTLPVFALAVLGMSAPRSHASDSPPVSAKKGHVTATLMADVDAVAPGEPFRVGVRFQMTPHWHIYWKYPGTGLPTQLRLSAADGWDVGETQWPVPTHFATSVAEGYGYESDILLFATITPPADATEGESVVIEAKPAWLVCEKECIRGNTRLALTLPIQAGAAKGAQAERFAKTQTQVPGKPPADVTVEPVFSVKRPKTGEIFELAVGAHIGGARVRVTSFFPAPQDGIYIKETKAVGNHATVQLKLTGEPGAPSERLDGVLTVLRDGKPLSMDVSFEVPQAASGDGAAAAPAKPAASPAAPIIKPAAAAALAQAGTYPSLEQLTIIHVGGEDTKDASLLYLILLAFIGGIILNVMPCVLPVLSIKVLGLVQQSGEDRKAIWRHGLAYAGGIFASFAILGAAIVAVQQGGKSAGWGFQFQHPEFVGVLGALIFAFGLNLFGVFEVSLPGTSRMGGSREHSYTGSFMNGVFATVLSTPCTAPFLGSAMGFALSQPPLVLMLMLMVVAFGFSFPFLLLAAMPQWTRFMPRPGPWMVSFKQFMGFLLVATTIWLVDILAGQLTRAALTGYLGLLGVIALGCWTYGRWAAPHRATRTRTLATLIAVGGIVAFSLGVNTMERGVRAAPPVMDGQAIVSGDDINWRSFASMNVLERRAMGETIFIDFTADWCVNCKVVEGTVIDTEVVRNTLSELGIVPVKADYTNEDEKIAAWLDKFERPGVPMYVVLPAGDPSKAFLMPELPGTDTMIEALKRGGPSRAMASGGAPQTAQAD